MFRRLIFACLGFAMQLNGSALQIVVGSTNPMKVAAVEEVVATYAGLSGAEIGSIAVESGVSDQPLTLAETVQGAKGRATGAHSGEGLGIGIESGLMAMPGGGYAVVCAAAVFDGDEHHVGTSCGVRLPQAVAELMVSGGRNLNEAMLECGLTSNERLGAAEGTIGLLTGGRISRRDHCKQALIMALVSIEHRTVFALPAAEAQSVTSDRAGLR